MNAEQAAYEELQFYTLGLRDGAFIHQHVVDAWAAQHATADGKPISLTFALVGLYLHLERGFTGRAVQLAHMAMAKTKHDWPRFALPAERGAVTAQDVMAAAPGAARDRAIDTWCASVWEAYRESHRAVGELLHRHGVI
ncbi:MAG TPA: DUF5946 family protein [Gemmatimonadaceae bacterium]